MRQLSRAVWLVLSVAAAACSAPGEGQRTTTDIRIDGSSTVFLLSEAVAEEYRNAGHAARVTVGQSGTGGGFQKFCRGEIDINDASRPIRPSELAACESAGIRFFELPVAYDGIAVVVHPDASWISHVTVDELRRLWAPDAQNTVRRWSQIRAEWPDDEIHLFGAGVDSGTYDYFTEAIVGQEGVSRGDFTASEDDNVLVQGIASDPLALGFLPYAYYRENQDRLKLVAVANGEPAQGVRPVAPDVDTIRSGTYQPLSRPLFIYVSERSAARPEVRQFVEYYIANVGALAEEVGYVELGEESYRLVAEHFRARRPGTLFGHGGSQVGVTIEQLLATERQ